MSIVEGVFRVEAVSNDAFGGGPGPSERDLDQQPDPSRFRLVIEEGAEAGSFIYKTLDRFTGEVVRQVPREEVLKLLEQPVRSGAVIDTSI